MKRISISVRIAICLTILSLCGVLVARLSGIFPDTRKLKLEGRAAVCESVAINCSLLAHRADIRGIEKNLNAFVLRNDEVLSAALRQVDGSLVVQVGNHQKHWHGSDDNQSTSENIFVPITAVNEPWGNVEIAFKPVQGPGLAQWLSPFVVFSIFITAFNALLFIFWLRRVLMHLDPSRVMPQRVRSALDTLAEGLLVLDTRGRIMMANKAFSEAVAERAEDLQGRLATELEWSDLEDVEDVPWSKTLADGTARSGVTMKLKASDENQLAFIVNAAPILGEDGKNRGVLASFDDVTELDTKKSELLKILRALKTSREEIQEQNVQLKRLATMDPLTECLNRRSFFPQFDAEWKQAQENELPLSGFMVDVDHFKSINDEHGHGKGDEVLKGVAACLREQVGDDGLVCRFGGEEFCALLPGFTLTQAAERAEQVRIALSACDFEVLTITASLGVSSIDMGADDPQGLLEQADKCLYVAKRNGRNQVVCYSPEMEQVAVDESKLRRTKASSDEHSAESQIPFAAVASLTAALAYRHADTAEHCSRVADLCVAAGRGVLSVSESYVLEIAALLHDIGKIGVPDAILLKPGKLTDEEWRVMKKNERIGAEIVGSAFDHQGLVDIIRYHTAPYSQQAGVKHMPHGEQLPTGARILAIADAYDAMLTKKNYRSALTQDDAFVELRRCAGIQFDPKFVERFIEAVKANPDLTRRTHQYVSRQAAIRVSTQIEELAKALDEQDLTAIEALSGRLQATAASSGASNVEKLAGRIHESVANPDNVSELFDLTMELTDLCRAAQRAQFTPTDLSKITT